MIPDVQDGDGAHVTTAPCVRSACDWSGFHWHWGERRFQSLLELEPEEFEAFDDHLLRLQRSGR